MSAFRVLLRAKWTHTQLFLEPNLTVGQSVNPSMVPIGFPLLEYVPHPHWLLSCRHEGPSQGDPMERPQIGAWLACFLIIALYMSINKVFSISPRSTLGTSRDKICLAISPHPLLMSGDQFQDDHHPGRDARSYGRVMHHQGLSRLRLRANTTSSFHNIQQCADLRFVKKIYTTKFPGLKFYTLKVPKLRLFLLKRKQR